MAYNWHIIEELHAEAKKHYKKRGRPKTKTVDDEKQYQHDYYMRITKPKRQSASAAKKRNGGTEHDGSNAE